MFLCILFFEGLHKEHSRPESNAVCGAMHSLSLFFCRINSCLDKREQEEEEEDRKKELKREKKRLNDLDSDDQCDDDFGCDEEEDDFDGDSGPE